MYITETYPFNCYFILEMPKGFRGPNILYSFCSEHCSKVAAVCTANFVVVVVVVVVVVDIHNIRLSIEHNRI